MTAEVLREAAQLMRSRAKSATPGPWFVPGADDEYVGPADVVGDGEPGSRYIICEHAGMDAEHIASWHPAVALAVADQLDAMAAVVTEAEGSPLAIVAAGLAEKSVAVANAYLGRS